MFIIEEEQYLNDLVTDSSIVGIEWFDGDRSSLVQTNCGKIEGMLFDAFTTTLSWDAESKKEYCKDVLKRKPKDGKNTVYVFNTNRDLFNWLSECTYVRET